MNPSSAIAALIDVGMSETDIGLAVGARQSTINRIKRGEMQPNYVLGKALVDLAEGIPDSRRGPAAEAGDAASTDGTSLQPLKAAA